MLGSRQRGDLRRKYPGNTAHRLLHGSSAPVTIVPAGYASAARTPVVIVPRGGDD